MVKLNIVCPFLLFTISVGWVIYFIVQVALESYNRDNFVKERQVSASIVSETIQQSYPPVLYRYNLTKCIFVTQVQLDRDREHILCLISDISPSLCEDCNITKYRYKKREYLVLMLILCTFISVCLGLILICSKIGFFNVRQIDNQNVANRQVGADIEEQPNRAAIQYELNEIPSSQIREGRTLNSAG